MSYFIFDFKKPVDVFKYTRLQENLASFLCATGNMYQETKNFSPQTMIALFELDIKRAITSGDLPRLRTDISVDQSGPIVCYKLKIFDVNEPIVYRNAGAFAKDIDCESSSVGKVELSELGHYVRDKLMQILWRYNADLVMHKSIYGQTHFQYQISFAPELIEKQVKSFEVGRYNAMTKLINAHLEYKTA